ncbi:MAG: DUF456 family protein [Steroidobacteraceae bacterium]
MNATLGWTISVLLMVTGFAGLVLPVLPGVPLMFAGMLLGAWLDDFTRIGPITLTILGVLTAVTLAIDFASGSWGAKRVGASRQAIVGAAIGTVAGLFFGLPGLLLGPFVGAAIGELLARGGVRQSLQVGVASWLGFAIGTVLKVAIAFAMLGVFGVRLLIG